MAHITKLLGAAIALPALLTACMSSSSGDQKPLELTATNLQHHNWELIAINDQPIEAPEEGRLPNLEIGEQLTANGYAGCNNYFGQVEIEDQKLRISKMGMTRKMCMPESMDIEMAMAQTLTQWSEVQLSKDNLILKGSDKTLTFKLRDWVN